MFPEKMNLPLEQRSRVVPLVGAALALMLVACGGGDDVSQPSGQGQEDEGSQPSGQEQEDLGTLRIIKVAPQTINAVPLKASLMLDVWEDTGLNVEVILGQADSSAPAMTTGDADLSFRGAHSQLANMVNGVPAKVVAGVRLPPAQYLVVSNESGIETLDDIPEQGITFGISGHGSSSERASQAIAEHYDLSEDEYSIVPLGDIQAILAAFKRGSVDAFCWSSGAAFRMEAEGFGRVLSSTEEFLPPSVAVAFTAGNEVIENRPKALKTFFETYFEVVERVKEDEELARSILVDEWEYPPEVAEIAIERELPTLSSDGTIPAENLENFVTTTEESFDLEEIDIDQYWQHWKSISE